MEQDSMHYELQRLQANLPFLLARVRNLEDEMSRIDRSSVAWALAMPALEQLRTYLLQELAPHLQESQNYFTGAAQEFQGHEKVMRLQQLGAELSQRIQAFRSSMALETYVGRESRPSLLWNLLADGDGLVSQATAYTALESELLGELIPSSGVAG